MYDKRIWRSNGPRVESPLGMPQCALCKGWIEGMLVSVKQGKRAIFYHELCYEDHWMHVMGRLR